MVSATNNALRTTPNLVLFDLDGTLADTAPGLTAALNEVCAEQNQPPVSVEKTRSSASSGARGLLRVGLGATPQSPGYDALRERFIFHYAKTLNTDCCLFPGMEETLDALEQTGIAFGVMTNKFTVFTHPILRHLKLMRRVCCVVCGDSTTPKPSPEGLFMACQVAGYVPQEAIYIGDDPRDIEAGRSAGMPTAVAAWGYLGVDHAPLERWGANIVLPHPQALLEFVRR